MRALTALVTVWCLGCDSIDPLLASARTTGDGMDCARAMTAPSTEESRAGETMMPPAGAVLSDESDRGPRYECDCQSCIVTAPDGAIVRAAAVIAGDVDVPEPGRLASVTRAPLVPPPQGLLDRA